MAGSAPPGIEHVHPARHEVGHDEEVDSSGHVGGEVNAPSPFLSAGAGAGCNTKGTRLIHASRYKG